MSKNHIKARIVNNFDEYRKWLTKYVSPAWSDAPLNKIKGVHAVPSQYPARVWLENRQYDESDWGDGKWQEVCVMTEDEFWCKRK